MKRTFRRKILFFLPGMAMIMVLSFAMPSVGRAYVQASGVVTADAAKVRKEPSTQSDSMASLLKGAMVTIIDESKDSTGALWYKVSYANSTGYIRSDLMLKATEPGASAAADATTSAGNTTVGNTTAGNTSTGSTASAGNTAAGNTAGMTTTTTTNSAATAASKPAATQVTAIAETKAYVNYKSARIRQGASTQHEIVGSAAENTPVVITGEAKASDGKKWYQIRFTNQNGREVVGFIRADLVTIGDAPAPVAAAAPAEAPAETPAETPAEQPEGGEGTEGGESAEGGEGEGAEGQEMPEQEPAPAETARPDYEMVYQANDEGVEQWYLFDNIEGTKQPLDDLRMWANTGVELTKEGNKQASLQKIIIIALAGLAAVLAVVVAILLFKLKDMYDEDYEEDEDEDEEEEDEEEVEIERPVRRRRPAASVQEKPQRPAPTPVPAPAPAAKARPVREKERRPVPVKRVEYDPEDGFEAGQPVVQKPQPKRKAKNFLIEDDEFEFEFLNMDDKK